MTLRVGVLTGIILVSGCTDQEFIPSVVEERASIEGQIRACVPTLKSGKWVRVDGVGQWSFGFSVDPATYRSLADSRCLKAVSDQVRGKRLDITFAYTTMQSATK